jgi:hypothetical protein
MMRTTIKELVAIGLVACYAGAGCANNNVNTVPVQTPLQLQQRFDAAEEIWDVTARDKSLHAIAIDATDANDSEIALKATGAITNASGKDDVASYAALKFNDAGDRPTAEKFVGMLADVSMRDDLHEKFAAEAPKNPATQP